jgi:hypothetical protein
VTTKTRRQVWFLVALIVVAAIGVVVWQSETSVGNGGTTARSMAQAQAAAASAVGDVRLELLEGRSGTRGAPDRNLFRFEARRDLSAPRVARGPARPAPAPAPTGPPPPQGPPPPPPIPLRFIGYVDRPGNAPRVGVLSDGRGNVFNGREGDIIEGRYRVLRIGTDSADLIYVDGRGRQTIRLSGQ